MPRLLTRIAIPPRVRLIPLLLLACFCASSGAAAVVGQRAPAEILASARALESNGEWEAAEQTYLEAAQDTGEAGEAARLGLARLLEKAGRYDDALASLTPLTALPPANERIVRAFLQQGSVLQTLERNPEAIAAYRRYIELGGPAASYARIEAAKLLAATDDVNSAIEMLAPLLTGGGPDHARRVALRQAARILDERGRADEALTFYRALAALTNIQSERVPALSKVGTLERARGTTTAAVEAFRELVQRYPATQEAEDALVQLTEIDRPAATLDAAQVHYRRRNNSTARTLYNGVLAGNAPPAEKAIASFYLGALAERRGEPRLAIENYTESYAADPAGSLAPEALWWRGQVSEEVGDLPEAQATYSRLVERHAGSMRVPEAVFRTGYLAYKGGNTAEARARWSAGMGQSRRDGAARAAFWAGKAAAEQGDAAAAQAAYAEAVRRDPAGYYGLRASTLLAGQPRAPRHGPGTLSAAPADWATAESWLTGWAGAEDTRLSQAFLGSEEWRTGMELLEAGWLRVATDALAPLAYRRQESPWVNYRLARAFADAGLPQYGIAGAGALLERAPAEAPLAIQRLAYPLPWPDLGQRFADRYGVDPLLLYAMMRQESAFNTLAGSTAGAFGLTQVIPSTAEEIARALGREGFRFADLARPVIAFEFGAYYLGGQVRGQEGSVYRGLAAYNGGGGSANRWVRAAGSGGDVDRFYEEIDFAETKLYVRIVTENYAWYRHLYGAAERPSVVRP